MYMYFEFVFCSVRTHSQTTNILLMPIGDKFYIDIYIVFLVNLYNYENVFCNFKEDCNSKVKQYEITNLFIFL